MYYYFARLFLFWLGFYCFNRIIFLLIQHGEVAALPFREAVRAFYFALPLDVSAACYSLAFSFLILWPAVLMKRTCGLKVLKAAVIILIFVQCAIVYGSAALYTQWHTRLDWKALAHFAHPAEPFKSSPLSLTFLFFAATLVFGSLYTWFYSRFIHLRDLDFPAKRKNWVAGVWAFPVIGFIIFTGIRGGWHRFPISLSIAYYSQYPVLNDASVNPSWSLIHDTRQITGDMEKNPYHWMPAAEAAHIVDSLYQFRKDTTEAVLNTSRPNIMLFVLESWPGTAVQAPASPAVTPFFDSLVKKGIYFDRCYATGFVSDEGIPGILSAFPTAGSVSILTLPQKTIRLPAINEILDSAGYHTGFIYGGALDFGNIKSYVFNKHFKVVKTDRDFPGHLHRGALGIPDALMAPYVAGLADQAGKPFFYCWYTLSSHPPYDIPTAKWMDYGGEQAPFMNTVHYTDSSLGLFFEEIKDKPWYKNTLFLFVSDHSHDTQYPYPKQDPARNRIPLLLYGDVIREEWRGKTVHKIVSQLDIAAILLSQLQLPHAVFPWSKNSFNPYAPQFAAFNYLTGSGFITSDGFISLEDQFPRFLLTDVEGADKIERLKRLNRAYEQQAYDYFLQW